MSGPEAGSADGIATQESSKTAGDVTSSSEEVMVVSEVLKSPSQPASKNAEGRLEGFFLCLRFHGFLCSLEFFLEL